MRLAGWKSRPMVDRYAKSTAERRAREAHCRMSLGDRFSTGRRWLRVEAAPPVALPAAENGAKASPQKQLPPAPVADSADVRDRRLPALAQPK
jgi:hypothetical protein